MNIAIDSRVLVSHFRGGILVYTERLIEHLAQIDDQNQYHLLFSGLRIRPEQIKLAISDNFHKRILPIPDREFLGKALLWREVTLPLFFLLNRTDVYHLPAFHDLTSFPKVKRVITIHDLRSVHLKGDIQAQDLGVLRRSSRIADRVVAVSEFTKKDIVKTFGVPEEKVRVAHLGVDGIFGPKDSPEPIARLKEKLGLDRPFFLSLGLVPRKNVNRLVSAWERFRHNREFSLVLAGHHGGEWVDQLKAQISAQGLEQSVLLPGAVSMEELVLLYNAALAFVFPSLLEGFGIPVLEAMACGTPVITSNISALPEVAGDAAMLVDPYDVTAIAQAMERVAEDGELREDLAQKGRERAKLFSWRKMAEGLLEVYTTL